MKNKTIKSVLEDELCTNCGTCVALCPKNAIMMEVNEKIGAYIPKLDENKCIFCGICYEVCPGNGINYNQMNLDLFGKKSENVFVGNFLTAYAGYSKNTSIRTNSSSGGLITQILIYALENNIINGALVTRMSKDNPLQPEPFIARTKEEIIEAAQSKYCPVPANVALREILESTNEEKIAVVGLPCHINGIRKAEQINKKLNDRIVLHIGLMCNHTPNFNATKTFIERQNVNEKDLIQIKYRGNGWPGNMEITTSEKKLHIPLTEYWRFIGSIFYYPRNCLTCSDGICELSDISFGDAWLQEYKKNDNIGTSICVVKNQCAKNILMGMVSNNELELDEIDIQNVIGSQLGMLYLKKINANSMRKYIKKAPKNNNVLKSDIIDDILSFYLYINHKISLNIITKRVLRHTPLKLIHLYSLPYKIMVSVKAKHEMKGHRKS